MSPEHATSLDLREHARELVGHMRRDLASGLEWVAIDHYNTDNPHVHLLVRGRDLDGRSLRIPRDYLSSGLRHRSQELATQRLGRRCRATLRHCRKPVRQSLSRELREFRDSCGIPLLRKSRAGLKLA